ncbi:het domain protein [Fusarium beomiforme]|uniref:Het domain protein n=1 Tax=Fusarium beomiforme TaxID=44412 RepID=A0A9P5AC79_9HYPO|nr:het domain protein [Fusarium beomiforme]
MDHIPSPSDDLAHAPIEVPCLFGYGFAYDDQGMLTYPARVGIDTTRLAVNTEPRLPLLDAAAFIQAWLWCGLLQEGFRVGFRPTTAPKHARSDLFVKHIDGLPFVSMKRLSEVASRACNLDRSPVAGDWHRERVLSCIDTASGFVEEVFRNTASETKLLVQDGRGRLPETTAVLLSVQVLCWTLLAGLNIPVYSDSKTSSLHPPLRQSTQIVDFLLQRSGWHHRDIAKLPQNIIFRHYLSFYRRQTDRSSGSWSMGADTSSSASPPSGHGNKLALVPKHTHPGCRCEFISANSAEVEDSFPKGKLVLVRFVQETCCIVTQSIRIESVVAMAPTMAPFTSEAQVPPFLAISHVRSEGLGNDTGHSLPFCQLAHLQSLADTVCASAEKSEAYFWIDSLCLPQNRYKRKLAVQAVWQVFRAARAVVVVDPQLSRHLVSSSEEALLRIRYSPWKSRLWTLEEGFFSLRLLFCFANRIVSLDEMLRDFESSRSALPLGAVPILQPCQALLAVRDEERLPNILVKLGYDVRLLMQVGSSSSSGTFAAADVKVDEGRHVSKGSMQRLLRLGYLMASKFRYLLEDDERPLILDLWRGIDKLYAPVGHEDCWGPNQSMQVEDAAARERVGQLCRKTTQPRALYFISGIGTVAVVIAWFILPEVARRTPAEIDEMLEKKVNLRQFKSYVTEVQVHAHELQDAKKVID